MRLSSIKLVGFKTFVEATTLKFPASLTAILGPNGCGKSNVIDAIRWVMGESSARQLRGDAMSDVIFAGTTTRKPVGFASVELYFENTLGKLGGEYNAYAELAIKRQVNRDGKSDYFLNGSRCRRKDITNIFLGTGLGPRSYAVIEQGMITRLVEAKPDDLRVFIEEAAGVSRYQSKRKETQQHLEHTRQNLLRLDDVQAELNAQIRLLKKQSHAVVKFRELDNKRHQIQLVLWRKHWQLTQESQQQIALELAVVSEEFKQIRNLRGELDLQWQQNSDDLATLLTQAEPTQQNWHLADRALLDAQNALNQLQRQRQQWAAEFTAVTQEQQQAIAQEVSDNIAKNKLQEQLNQSSAELASVTEMTQHYRRQLLQAETQFSALQEQLTQLNGSQQQDNNQYNQKVVRLDDLNKQVIRMQAQQRAFENTLQQLAKVDDAAQIDDLVTDIAVFKENIKNKTIELSTLKNNLLIVQAEQKNKQDAVNDLRQQQSNALGELSVLTQLLSTVRHGQKNDSVEDAAFTCLLDELELTETGKQFTSIIERFLASWLTAIKVEHVDAAQTYAYSYNANQHIANNIPAATQPMTSWIAAPQNSLWCGVGVVTNLQQASKLQAQLTQGQSILTQDGYWLGLDWCVNLNVATENNVAESALQHSQRKTILQTQVARDNHVIEMHTKALTLTDEKIVQLTTAINTVQTQLTQEMTAEQSASVNLARFQSSHAANARQKEQHIQQIAALELSLAEDANAVDELNMDIAQIQLRIDARKPALEKCKEEIDVLRTQRDTLAHNNESHNALYQQLTLAVQTTKIQIEALTHAAAQNVHKIDVLQEKLAGLQQQIMESDNTLPTYEQAQINAAALAESAQFEWKARQSNLERVQAKQQQLALEKTKVQTQEDTLRDVLEEKRLAWQRGKAEITQLEESIATIPAGIQEPMPDMFTQSVDTLNTVLQDIIEQLTKIGELNLTAPTQLEELDVRSKELLHQVTDLEDTVVQLEAAMHTIDLETKELFTTTLKAVNQELQQLFPKVFGGGVASLTLEDDWQSGVRFMAQPPGKKNSSISLLSGGEKALAALALVFSIFRLNPAPFCLLDEVDAPLDDKNVERFCNLVKELSQQVQFIYITHNKLAMTMAHDLLGVTMPEPGVSKLVSVNLEQADQFITVH